MPGIAFSWLSLGAFEKGTSELPERRPSRILIEASPRPRMPVPTGPITAKGADFFAGQGVEAIDLARRFQGGNPAELRGSRLDHPPGEAAHAEVVELFCKCIMTEKQAM
jgi:hypothetical protein